MSDTPTGHAGYDTPALYCYEALHGLDIAQEQLRKVRIIFHDNYGGPSQLLLDHLALVRATIQGWIAEIEANDEI